MKPREVVLERSDGPSEPAVQPPDLDRPSTNPIVSSPYLNAVEAAAYVRSKNVRAFYKWFVAHQVPAYGSRGKLLFLRRDLDEGLKPAAQRGRRRFFASHRGGRS